MRHVCTLLLFVMTAASVALLGGACASGRGRTAKPQAAVLVEPRTPATAPAKQPATRPAARPVTTPTTRSTSRPTTRASPRPTTGPTEQSADGVQAPPAPALSPEEALKTFTLAPGFRIEVVAAEPLIQDPVVIAF